MSLNRLHIEELMKVINSSPYFQLLDMYLADMGIGYAIMKTRLQNRHLSPYGAIQGGVYASLIDAAAYWAPYAELDEKLGLITLDVTVNNLASVNKGELTVTGKRIKTGKTICLAEASITDESGRILAQGSSKLLVTQGLQTIEQMAARAGVKLPPKILAPGI